MIEYLAPGFIYSVAKDIWGRVHSRKRKLSAAEVVELRKKWKSEFEPRMWEWYQKKLRDDIIIRDMKRFDSYPDIDENANGISPWFRARLVAFAAACLACHRSSASSAIAPLRRASGLH
jgi:hypothetical protein